MSSPQRGRVLRSDAVVHSAQAALGLDLQQVNVQSFDPARVDAAVAEGQRQGLLQGTREGFAVGYADGQAAAVAEIADLKRHLHGLLLVLRDQLAVVADVEAGLLRQLEAAIVTAGFELAEAIVVNEVRTAVHPGAEALTRALALAPTGAATATLHLHPDDVATLGDVSGLALGTRVSVVGNPSIEYGGCVLEVGDCIIDAQLGPALQRAREAMLVETGGLVEPIALGDGHR